jgi:DNA recombination protein Rad52
MTQFSDVQITALDQPLQSKHVSQRKGAGNFQLSYLEGHHMIREANRIFGFDGWSRETVDVRIVVEHTKAERHGVTYTARVRITIGGLEDRIVREGSGVGHGIDRSLGQAHEAALKEAETDAMKRALMTFGDQFGLALYDKNQEHVV